MGANITRKVQEGLLSPYRVLDLSDGMCMACGKILADMGAEVIKIEKPGGDHAQSTSLFHDNIPQSQASSLWLAFNQGKQSVTLNLGRPRARAIFESLVKLSDIVIESYEPGYLSSIGLGYEALQELNPGVVLTSITGFGQTGPYARFRYSDLVVMALGGYLFLCGDPDRSPVRVSYPMAFYLASAEAAASSMAALYYRNRTGKGQKVDVSAQQVVATYTSNAPAFWEMRGRLISRSGPNRAELTTSVKAPQIWECKDGYVSFAIYGGQIGVRCNVPLVAWIDSEGMADEWLKGIDWGKLDMTAVSQEFFDEVGKRLSVFFLKHTKQELFFGAIERQIILFPVYTVAEIAEDQQLAARQFWVEVEHPEISKVFLYPGAFAKPFLTPLHPGKRAPLSGEHNQEIYGDLLNLGMEGLQALQKEGVI